MMQDRRMNKATYQRLFRHSSLGVALDAVPDGVDGGYFASWIGHGKAPVLRLSVLYLTFVARVHTSIAQIIFALSSRHSVTQASASR
jgi:hypothetical protein